MRRATPEVIYSHTSAANAVTFTVEPGETFEVETVPNCGRTFDTHTGERHPDAEGGINPSTGCIAVAGARPGQVAVVHVLNIDLHEWGYTLLGGPGDGPINSPVLGRLRREDGWQRAFKPVRTRNSFVEWSDALKILAAPMIGYVGVARPNEALHNGHNGEFGGNFDVQEITAGARVHLPVFCDDLLLHVGDVHAVQGDGEIDGAGGIETAAVLTLRVELADRPKSFRNPRIETDEFIATTGFSRPAERAFNIALEDLIAWLGEDFGHPPAEAHMLLAQAMEARATQFVNPLVTYICKLRRQFLAR